MNKEYVFDPQQENMFETDPPLEYFQLCSFKNPKTNKHHVRKFVINNNNDIMQVKNYWYNSKQCKQLMKMRNQNQYKCLPMYDLVDAQYPMMADIIAARSKILSRDFDYSGFAPF